MTDLTPTELHYTWVSIERFGGGFCERLARAWFHGDDRNKARLNQAFEHLITEFGPGSRFYSHAS
jgi:hypothetical protein